jgi:O-antigen ligase
MQQTSRFYTWITSLDQRAYGVVIGLIIGISGGLIGLMLAVAGPVIAVAVVLGALAGIYVLSNISAALYGVIFVTLLFPFGTLPFRVGITPTFLDVTMGVFVFVYLALWMSGRRQSFRFTPVYPLLGFYLLWLLLCFALGLRFALPTSATLRQFAETILSISVVFILVDLLRDIHALRRLALVIMVAVGIQALITLILYILPNDLAERTLIRLARFGYPDGGVIRYIEDNPAAAERAIGTWVDPNALGGILAISAAMIAPQIFAKRPILPYRWLTFSILGIVTLALLLTFSRASMLAFAVGLCFIGLFRGYRRFLVMVALGALLLLWLPQTRTYIERFTQAFTGSDRATQMRLGEYGDALQLISQHPIVGVGFTGTPEIDLYTNVASLYLIMANQIGLVGLAIFLLMIAAVFVYGWYTRQSARRIPELESIHLSYHAALLTGLLNATADLYFFRLDFHASITFFWLVVALALVSSHLALKAHESTVVKMGRMGYYSRA